MLKRLKQTTRLELILFFGGIILFQCYYIVNLHKDKREAEKELAEKERDLIKEKVEYQEKKYNLYHLTISLTEQKQFVDSLQSNLMRERMFWDTASHMQIAEKYYSGENLGGN